MNTPNSSTDMRERTAELGQNLDGQPYVWRREPMTCSEWWSHRRAHPWGVPLSDRVRHLRASDAVYARLWREAFEFAPMNGYQPPLGQRCGNPTCVFTFTHIVAVCDPYQRTGGRTRWNGNNPESMHWGHR